MRADHTSDPASEQDCRQDQPALTIGAVRRQIAARLAAARLDQPALDARILMGHALNLSRDHLLTQADQPVPAEAGLRLEALVVRRLAREPVSRILGRREFWSLDFTLAPETLDPRPDSETVVEAALALTPVDAPLAILDLGTGSGCLLLAVLSERPQAWGLGIDASSGAVAAAAANAAPLGLTDRARFVQRDWTQPDWRSGLVEGIASPRFDVILANPPYIPDGDIPGLEPEVTRFDPLAALAGGTDGLDAYRRLAPQLPDLLTPNGVVVFEVGFGQAHQVAALFVAAGLQCLGTRTDLGGIERCVLARSARRSIG